MTESLAGGAAAAPLSLRATATVTSAALRAARQLMIDLERGRRIDAAVLRRAMEAAFGASDATGIWNWKTAYDVCEAATVLFLRKFGPAIRVKAGSPAAMLPMLARIARCLPTHTRRSEDSQALQQFSTPIPLGLAACTAAGITRSDGVLEPSAGTGLLAIFARGIEAGRPRRKAARFICGRPPTCKDWLWQHARTACAHMSGLFSGLATTGQDGLRGQ